MPRVLIVGDGIAGASLAYVFARERRRRCVPSLTRTGFLTPEATSMPPTHPCLFLNLALKDKPHSAPAGDRKSREHDWESVAASA